MIKKTFETLFLAEIYPYDNNPRINDDAVRDVMESIRQCENLDPIEIDEDNVILAGHTRHKALQRLGIEKTEVIRYVGLTEEQKKKYRLLSNKTNERSEWDFEKLAEELEELDFDGYDFGFEDFEEDVEVQLVEDDPPELPEESDIQVGDMFQLGNHRLICGDSTDPAVVKRLVGDKKMHLFITDPPYNVDYEGTAGKIANDKQKDEDFLEFLTNAFKAADSVMRPGAAFYIWHADSEGYNFRTAIKNAGWTTRQVLIWRKSSLVMGRQDYQWNHEPCAYGWKEGAAHTWTSDRKQTTVIDFPKPSKSELHPTMKPVGLFGYQINNNTNPGDCVLDLFGGSGTTMIACEQLGRSSYLAELDPKYCKVIIERWQNMTNRTAEKI